jgi:hypothetical protein
MHSGSRSDIVIDYYRKKRNQPIQIETGPGGRRKSQHPRLTKPKRIFILTLKEINFHPNLRPYVTMSKLESFIRRMLAQRDCLNFAVKAIEEIPGPVLEIGLGNGRTYDHLRQIMPDRDIYVFERNVKSFASCTPPENRLFMGEITETLVQAFETLGKTVALAHYDIGTTNSGDNRKMADRVSPLLNELMFPGSLVVSSVAMSVRQWSAVSEPVGVKPGRYFIYSVDGSL